MQQNQNLVNLISIHAPRGGSDCIQREPVRVYQHFNPRSPWGERLRMWSFMTVLPIFQSTLPVGGATFVPNRLVWQH